MIRIKLYCLKEGQTNTTTKDATGVKVRKSECNGSRMEERREKGRENLGREGGSSTRLPSS